MRDDWVGVAYVLENCSGVSFQVMLTWLFGSVGETNVFVAPSPVNGVSTMD